jgi:hypothetical protein
VVTAGSPTSAGVQMHHRRRDDPAPV